MRHVRLSLVMMAVFCSLFNCFGIYAGRASASDLNDAFDAGDSTISTFSVSATIPGFYYKLINSNSGKALDIANGDTVNGSNVQIWTDNNTEAQKWKITRNSDGTYKLINPKSGKALDVEGAGTANASNVQIWTDNSSAAQKWTITSNSDGTYKLTNPHSGKVLDVSSAKVANGTDVAIWQTNSTAAQKWILVKTTASAIPLETAPQKKADRIITLAETMIGKVRYVFGESKPSQFIFDCSSFTKFVFASEGIDLIWSSAAQSHQGKAIYNKDDLRRGDLVHFSTSTPGQINHVGIYMGNGKFIQNTTPIYGLEISDIYQGWYSDHFIVGTRVIPGL